MTKRSLAAVAAALSILLTGCGGDGDSPSADSDGSGPSAVDESSDPAPVESAACRRQVAGIMDDADAGVAATDSGTVNRYAALVLDEARDLNEICSNSTNNSVIAVAYELRRLYAAWAACEDTNGSCDADDRVQRLLVKAHNAIDHARVKIDATS